MRKSITEFKFKMELPYMTAIEMRMFKSGVEQGAISIYRVARCVCDGCDEYILKGKCYCSEDCFQKSEDYDGTNDDLVDG